MTTILLADDNRDVRWMIAAILKKLNPDLRVIEASDGRAALRWYHRSTTPLDGLLLDCRMPPDNTGAAWLLERLPADCPPVVCLCNHSEEGASVNTTDRVIACITKETLARPSVAQALARLDFKALSGGAGCGEAGRLNGQA